MASLLPLDATNFTSILAATPLALVLFTLPACPNEPARLKPMIAEALASSHVQQAGVGAFTCSDHGIAFKAGARVCPALRLYRGRSDGVSAAEDEPEYARQRSLAAA